MKVPCCKVHCVGEVTSWGKQFLGELQAQNVIEATFSSTQDFMATGSTSISAVLAFVENTPESKKSIAKMRAGMKSFFFVWYGRGFTKEDYQFAVEMRAYAVLEHARAEDPKVLEIIAKAAENVDAGVQFEQIIHSLKALLLEDESSEELKPIVTELKTAITKLEKSGLKNEMAGVRGSASGEGATPFHKAQGFSDALITVSELERTGALWIKADLPGNEGHVEFIQGKIVSAVSGESRGLKAIYRMFLWDQPKFLFTRRDPEECNVEEQLSMSMKAICERGAELRTRYERIRREIPPLELKIELEPSSLHVGTKLNPDDFSTLASVVEFGKVSQVIDNNKLPDVLLLEGLIRLKKQNMIRVAVGT